MALKVGMCLLTIIAVMLINFDLSEGYRVFTVSGQPVCFVSYRDQRNYQFNKNCGSIGNNFQLHCSTDYECCFDKGPACCVERNALNQAEVTGIVLGCVAFVVLVVCLTVCISIKCCSKGKKK